MSFFNGYIIAREQAYGTQAGATPPPIITASTGDAYLGPSYQHRRRKELLRLMHTYVSMKVQT
jgi:hypothetical protein